MCKIAAFTNSSKLDIKKASEAIGELMLELEPDGFGYAAFGKSGTFGERCVSESFQTRLGKKGLVKLPIIECRQQAFGTPDKLIGPAIFHGRTSTNSTGILNCHPMTRGEWHLIHNGVVSDYGGKYDKFTTNDSEDVLHRLMLGINEVEKHLSGYYAFAAIDPNGRLHIGRDSIATLYVAWSDKIESHVIATTEELLTDISSALKLKIGPIDKIQDDSYSIMIDNDLVHFQNIKPRGYDKREASLAETSLGRKLSGIDSEDYETKDFRFNDGVKDVSWESILAEMNEMDDRYSIQTYEGYIITADEFRKLDQYSQAECTIERPDGTLVENWYLEYTKRA